MTLKYNYVICGSLGYYEIGYRDIMSLECVNYYESYNDGVKNRLIRLAIRLNFSKKVNRIIASPFSSFVYPYIYKPHFKNIKPLCYIFFGHVEYIYQTSFLKYLRKTYPGIKIVLYMQDLISRNSLLNFDSCRETFDLILSYDQGDCKKYGLYFHPTPMSLVKVPDNNKLEKYDVYFCGYAKSRYPIINRLYKILTAKGLKCDFYLMNYPDNEHKINGVHYNEPLFSYEQNIQHVLNSRCVLEVMQDNADGFTPRVWESIMYDRHLLTNNTLIGHSEFYNSRNMHFIKKDDVLSWINTDANYSESEKTKLSPVHLLQFIDSLL